MEASGSFATSATRPLYTPNGECPPRSFPHIELVLRVMFVLRGAYQQLKVWLLYRLVDPELRFRAITIRFEVLFVLVVLAHHRRRVVYFNVTEHPTAQWNGQQIIEAFPWDTAPKYLLRDRDAIYGSQFKKRVQSMGIEEVLSAPRSPLQNAFVERIIGSIRRDCLAHVIVLNDRRLKRILTSYFNYYHRWRTHLSLEMDSSESRSVQLPANGKVVQFPEVGGLHHQYERLAA